VPPSSSPSFGAPLRPSLAFSAPQPPSWRQHLGGSARWLPPSCLHLPVAFGRAWEASVASEEPERPQPGPTRADTSGVSGVAGFFIESGGLSPQGSAVVAGCSRLGARGAEDGSGELKGLTTSIPGSGPVSSLPRWGHLWQACRWTVSRRGVLPRDLLCPRLVFVEQSPHSVVVVVAVFIIISPRASTRTSTSPGPLPGPNPGPGGPGGPRGPGGPGGPGGGGGPPGAIGS
jgi:hypothetical protein